MVAPICEPTVPSDFKDFHFRVREPAPLINRDPERKLHDWIERIMVDANERQYSHRPLNVEWRRGGDDDTVLFVSSISSG